MADDPQEAIGIIGALSEAGLLRNPASGASESVAGSQAIGIIGALREAGLLATGTVGLTAAPPPDPQQGPQVGELVRAYDVRQLVKRIATDGSKGLSLVARAYDPPRHDQPGRWWQIECEFPPNDGHWLAEIEKILASPKPSVFSIQVEVTRKIARDDRSEYFEGKIKDLRAVYRIPALPQWTEG